MSSTIGIKYWSIPQEMQNLNQWCIAGPDKAPYLVGETGPYHASPVKGPWMDFSSACYYANIYNAKIGFIICESDPFSCIDMDIKDCESVDAKGLPVPEALWTAKLNLDFFSGIVDFAQSYTELSASGKGLHVWVKGSIGAGRRGKGMEVYSQERFIVCTGTAISKLKYHTLNNMVIPLALESNILPIVDGSILLQRLEQELGLASEKLDLLELEETYTDQEIWARASSAGNADKFIDLCGGDWAKMGFPSQSEADLALMSIFTFYSKSNEQCRRMFRQTFLGKREKAVKDDVFLNRTLTIIRSRQAREEERANHGEAMAKRLLDNMRMESTITNVTTPIPQGPAPVAQQSMEPEGTVDPRVLEIVRNLDQTQLSQAPSNVVDFTPPDVEGLEWPPGLVGAIAGFIYQSAPRPVKEVAIVAALGLMAGIVGKAYNVGQTGINLYIILIARSAVGKEAMHSGIGHILRSKCGNVISPFVDYKDYASGPALTKAMEGFSSFVNIHGEWGRKLKRMSEDSRDGPMSQLRTVMTNIYQKSGAASVMGGLAYSKAAENVSSVNAVAYTMIGETTPATFYESLTQSMMDDGFLSRFNIIEYLGERPAENKNQLLQVPDQISDTLASIASHSLSIVSSPKGNAIQVGKSPEIEEFLNEFNLYCDDRIREAAHDESLRQIWNRAHLKVIRVAGVLAAADNHIKPVITREHAEWAKALIISDAEAMLEKVNSGDIGLDDTSRFLKLQVVLREYIRGKTPSSYKVHAEMLRDGIVPRRYLQSRTSQLRCYQNYRMGATLALDHTIKTAIDSGYMVEISKDLGVQTYAYHGRAFRILDVT